MKLRCLLTVIAMACTSALANQPDSLCTAEEQVVFSCSLDSAIVSVCASPALTLDSGHVQFRIGTSEKIAWVHPEELQPPAGTFFLSTAAYAGGGASAIRFRRDGEDYLLFDRTVRTNFAPGEPNDPEMSAGFVILRTGDSKPTYEQCADNVAGIRGIAYELLPREEFALDAIELPVR